MRLLALAGSLALFVYIVVCIWLTSVNVSRYLFSEEGDADPFFRRQTTIFLWPLMIVSEDGREALAIFWNKENDQ